ncbi:MAG: hypothetical protein KatS3mg105_0465 [Gemmatales bacterium]|nr:MAG: hypothetical protein KatS3mg105_0465 [Gemmatales bacterium]
MRLRSVFMTLICFSIVAGLAVRRDQAGDAPTERLPVLRTSAPQFFKGNLHTHSLWSDGDNFPELIADWYKTHGYHFLALSDHNILSEGQKWVEADLQTGKRREALKKYLARFGPQWVEQRTVKGKNQVRLKPLAEFRSVLEEPGRFLMIQGEEITHRFGRNPVHMNAVHLRDVIQPVDGDSVEETIRVNQRAFADQRKRVGRPMLLFLNHPNFGWGVRAEDFVGIEALRFFEIYNGHPGVRNYGDEWHASCERMWDIVLSLRLGKLNLPVIYGVATDDAHRYHEFNSKNSNPGRGWIMVQAPYLTAEAIVQAMHEGRFYCSTGVTLKDVRFSNGSLSVSIRPEKGVTYKTQYIATMRGTPLESEPVMKDGKPIAATARYSSDIGKIVLESDKLESSYRLTGKEWYVRARVISSKPHPNPYRPGDVEMAWTQPVVP